jgi:flavin reductase
MTTAGSAIAALNQKYVRAMATAATGVTVVATDGPGGRAAQTVSAMCSVSADPALILVCLHGRSPVNAAIEANKVFCVNVLATQHDHVADTFAGRPWAGKDRWDFTCGHWDVANSGSPRVYDAIASFDCETHDIIAAGTHLIYIGRVTAVEAHSGDPLVYSGHTYCKPTEFEPSVFPDYPDAHPATRRRNTK